jgi:decaprenylphospho-beta-D-ribofuranose 2-oxidase
MLEDICRRVNSRSHISATISVIRIIGGRRLRLSGWGKYPVIEAEVGSAGTQDTLAEVVSRLSAWGFIPRGMGRSYGDSSLASHVLNMLRLDRMLAFDGERGLLKCEAGLSLEDILEIFVPRGWFLPVVPGTKFVTVGGAIASDVHGKNHHRDGSFCSHVESLDVMLADGTIVTCSPDENPELFHAVCGGMGLMGVVVRAVIRLRKVPSAYIRQVTYAARNLEEVMDLFIRHSGATYSVAWLDCVERGRGMGRSILMLGEHAQPDEFPGGRRPFQTRKPIGLSVPFDLPGFILNPTTVKAFNALYYWRKSSRASSSVISYEPFFFPLDSIHNWNRIYGKRGFVQYQFVLPFEAGKSGLTEILDRVSRRGTGSFLAVLKLFGEGNDNLLSFPMKGWTIALDFPVNDSLWRFLDELDRIVLDHGGRLYLAKDARMTAETFRAGYPGFEEFSSLKRKYDSGNTFRSLQATRLGLV